jgi:SAM-dependent MidA family methyltransferase
VTTVREDIEHRIRQGGRITFADFVKLALYAPGKGYYSTPANRIGKAGDYFTSPHLHPVFGAMVGKQVAQMWEVLGHPGVFEVVEMGVGCGYLREDVLSYLADHRPDVSGHIQYLAFDTNSWHQEKGIAPARDWAEGHFVTLPSRVTGCFLSNELVDAFPVHVISRNGGLLQEVYVDLEGENLVECLGPLSSPRIKEQLSMVECALPEGCRAEVNLSAVDWIRDVAAALERGFVLTIDYGDLAPRLYSRLRSEGTMQCYRAHKACSNPFSMVGEQDITAHVDFTALAVAGRRAGLEVTGYTTQALFLAGLRIDQAVASLDPLTGGARQSAMAHLAMHELLQPDGLGGLKVLIQHKGVVDPALDGLRFST